MAEISTNNFKNSFSGESLSNALKMATVLASIASFLYLHGFGWTAKINILAYVTFSDYLKVAIGWIVPALVLPVCCGYLLPGITTKLGHLKDSSPQKSAPSAYERRASKYFRIIFAMFALLSLLSGVLLWLGVELRFVIKIATLAGISGWLAGFTWYTKSPEILLRLNLETAALMFFVPLLLIFSFGSGLAHGAVTGKRGVTDCDLVAINTGTGSPLCGELLFSFEKFIVIRESGRTELILLPSDKIASIQSPFPAPNAGLK